MALVVALSLQRQQRLEVVSCLSDFTNVIRCPNISLMLNNFGIEDGATFRRVVQSILTMGGLSEQSTMSDLHRLLRIDIIFVAHNLIDGRTVHLTAEETPDLLVCDAIFASCCVPFLFAPVKYNGLVLCDGALSSYTPVMFAAQHTLQIICPPWYKCENIDTWFNFLRSFTVTCTVHQRSVIDAALCSEFCIHATHPFMETIDVIEKKMSPKMSNSIIQCGYIAGMLYLNKTLASTLASLVTEYANCQQAFHQIIARHDSCADVRDVEGVHEIDPFD